MAFPYVRHQADWKNAASATGGGDTSTPITETALDTIEAGIKSLSDILALVDAKGDLIVGTAADTHARKAVGSDNGVLTADSAQSDGLIWKTIVNAMVSATAAIARSKLASTTLAVFTPLHNEPPAANYATLDTRNSHPTLDFDAATDESAVFRGVLSRDYGSRGLTVKVIWAATSATSGNVIWGAQIERVPAGALDIDADSFATAITATGAADSVSGETTETEIAFTDGAAMDSLVAGEMFRLKVYRDADNVSDTMTGDAELLAVEVRET